jgi:predicted esterase
VLLHGQGDTGANLANSLVEWVEEGYVVCAPSATEGNWDNNDVAAAIRIGAHLKKALPIGAGRVHVMGFSNGGWNLAPLAFSDELRPCSAVWIAAGFKGGKAPKWAKKELGVLAVAGKQDPNADAALQTVPLLEESVRSAEARLQDDLGHQWPNELMPYARWWQGAQEGRFAPGVDQNFAWGDDLDAAIAELAGAKKGGVLVYAWSPGDAEKPEAKELQNHVLMDPLVRHYGNQLKAVKLEAGDRTAALGVKTTPAVAVLDRVGSVKKVLEGKIKASALASALRSVAPDKGKP